MKETAADILLFKLEKYTRYPVLCNFMRPFKFFEKDRRHQHENFYELVIFVDGTTLDQGEEDMQILHAGYFFMYAPGSVHNYGNMRDTKYFNVLIAKDVFESLPLKKNCMPEFEELFPEYGKRSKLFHLNAEGLKQAMAIAFDMQQESDSKPAGWLEMLLAQLQMLMIILWRNRKESPETNDENVSFRINRSILFMEKHLTENLSISDLAKYVSMSESSFRHSFKAVTSFSPIHYLVRLRLKNALRLIFIGRSIAQSAVESGLRDSSYFGRMCRRYLGGSPSDIIDSYSKFRESPEALAEKVINHFNVQEVEK